MRIFLIFALLSASNSKDFGLTTKTDPDYRCLAASAIGVFHFMETKEIWRSVVGFEGLYDVSSHGKIKSLDRLVEQVGNNGELRKIPYKGQILKQKISSRGYLTQALYVNGGPTYCLVHRLIARAFIPNPENKPQVNHINGIKTDNRVENLEWCTHSENQKEAFRLGLRNQNGEKSPTSKLTEAQVLEIRAKAGTKSHKKIGMEYGICRATVSFIITRKSWAHI